MKKRVLSVLLCLMFLASPILLAGCGEKEEIKVSLNTTNYDKFLSVNITYSDLSMINVSDDNNIYNWYDKVCIGNILIQTRVEGFFSNCEIEFSFFSTRSWNLNPNKIKMNVSYHGESYSSFILTKGETILKTVLPSISDLKVDSITGFVVYSQ